MFTKKEQEIAMEVVRQRAMYLRGEQRKIEIMRINIKRRDFMEIEYSGYTEELINLNIIFTKLCHL